MRDYLRKETVLPVLLALVGLGALMSLNGFGDDSVAGRARFDAIGDSITWGVPIAFGIDSQGVVRASGHVHQGWPELLATLLPAKDGVNAPITNLGISGAVVRKVAATHPRRYLSYFSEPPDALLLIGTNDSNSIVETPSGLGCSGTACDGTYKATLNWLIDNLMSNGREKVFIGLVPPTWGNNSKEIFADPLGANATRNALIQEYNRVIVEDIAEKPGVVLGPDLFSCFLTPTANRFSLFEDVLHPNTLGQVYMAALWREALAREHAQPPTDHCTSPIYILESLDSYRHGQKQNLLAVGDPYYTDEEFTLVDIPAELVDGLWIMQPNANRDNQDDEYLEFDAGPSPVTVYIAFDASGSPPVSRTHAFVPTRLSSQLKVSDSSVERLDVVMAENIVGVMTIGGNKSARTPGQQQGYLVVVVP